MKKVHPIPIVLSIILFFLMWTLAGWQTDDWDWINYERSFYNPETIYIGESLDISYIYITTVINDLGYSFYEYRQIIYFAYLLIVLSIILKYSSWPFTLSLFYFCALFFRDTILIRNTLALGFLLIGLFYLLRDDIKNHKKYFVVFWLISCTFHVSFVEYGIFLLCDKKINTIRFALICILMSFGAHSILETIVGYSGFADMQKLQNKANGYLSNGSYISLAISTFTITYNYIHAKVQFKKARDFYVNKERYLKFNLLFFAILIFTSINMEFMRLYNNMLLVNAIIIFDIYKRNKNKTTENSLMLLFWVIWNFIWIIPLSGVGPQIELIISKNAFWN